MNNKKLKQKTLFRKEVKKMKKTVLILLTLGLLLGMTFLGSAYALEPLESTSHTEIWYTYENGILIDQGGTITTNGVDGQGADYAVVTTLTYETINNKPVLANSYSETHSVHDDGSESWSQRTTDYVYNEKGMLTEADGTSYTKGYGADTLDEDGNEIRGGFYDSNADQTYELIQGEAQVVSSKTIQYSYIDDTKETVTGSSESTTTYEYDVILGVARLKTITSDSHGEDKTNYDPSGNPAIADQHTVTVYEYNAVGSLINAFSPEEECVGNGTQLGSNGWETYTSTIETTYGIWNGIALRLGYYEDKVIVPMGSDGGPTGNPPPIGIDPPIVTW
ncbi:MAG: hypothetical protein U9R31_03990 [Candidatus Omnitrophota bacterium]|nr:hypothetical protein [Candidatus Omnitrophota bacterium]